MDIQLNKDIVKFMRSRYGIDARHHPRCIERAAATLVQDLEVGGIIKKCEGLVDFLARKHFSMKQIECVSALLPTTVTGSINVYPEITTALHVLAI